MTEGRRPTFEERRKADDERRQRQWAKIEPLWDESTGPWSPTYLDRDRSLESIAISLKRIADILEKRP